MFNTIIPTSKEELNQIIDDEIIYAYYFGNFDLDHWYTSPFRDEDKSSFTLSFYNNEIKWRDFGLSPNPRDAVEYYQADQRYNYDNPISYLQSIRDIYNEIYVKDKTAILNSSSIDLQQIQSQKKVKKIIQPTLRFSTKYKSHELEFWKPGLLTEDELLNKYFIYPDSTVSYNGKIVHISTRNNPTYAFLFSKKDKIWKSYAPKAKTKLKFFANNVAGHIQGWELMEKHIKEGNTEFLFITSSFKDVVGLDKLNYPAIAPHSENMFLDLWIITYLKTVFKHIYVFYDNDYTGVTKSIQFTQQHNLYYINVPDSLTDPLIHPKKIKDPWNVIEYYGYPTLENVILDRFARNNH